jgi:hypothetical protein
VTSDLIKKSYASCYYKTEEKEKIVSPLLKEKELNKGAATHTQRNDDKAMVVDFLFCFWIHSFLHSTRTVLQYYSTTVVLCCVVLFHVSL